MTTPQKPIPPAYKIAIISIWIQAILSLAWLVGRRVAAGRA